MVRYEQNVTMVCGKRSKFSHLFQGIKLFRFDLALVFFVKF